MAGCEGPAYALWVVLAPQFDLRWKTTPQGLFLPLSSSALHFGRLGHRERKSLIRLISLISPCGWVYCMTAGCEGPVYALWVVLAAQFDLRWEATPLGFFLRLSSPALHFGRLGHRERKSLTRLACLAQPCNGSLSMPVRHSICTRITRYSTRIIRRELPAPV
jgi:hypothetical protein